ncbi:hypothetical protein F5X98DRAFT_377290 [Xylaria grammica]|nr:hypothetical protein F5X98DRAFT_377290 [Xylaria grammica]
MSGAIAIWLCNGLVTCLIFARLGLRKWRRFKFTMGDWCLVVALVFNGLRVVGDYYTNKYGTPLNTSVRRVIAPAAEDESAGLELTTEEQNGLVLAGKLAIASRIAIVVVFDAGSQSSGSWWVITWSHPYFVGFQSTKPLLQAGITYYNFLADLERPLLMAKMAMADSECRQSAVLGLTFLACILSVFLECEQLKLNWILFPDPEECSYDRLWIITYELSNIITDTMLFFQPILLILGAPISKWERAWLSLFGLGAMLVFGLGALLIAVEVIRLVEGLPFTNVILNRIVWGSIEVAIAASVATLPSIYILMRLGFGKRQKEDWDKTQGDSGELVVTDVDIWDGNMPAPADMTPGHSTRKQLIRNSFQSSLVSSILSSALAGTSNQDNKPKPRSRLRHSLRSSGTGSRISSRLRGADGDLRDTLSGWIELEEVDIESAAEVPSPEPDDAEQRGGGIFIATEINQETHQAWESDERPRIVTIPRRAKLDGALV